MCNHFRSRTQSIFSRILCCSAGHITHFLSLLSASSPHTHHTQPISWMSFFQNLKKKKLKTIVYKYMDTAHCIFLLCMYFYMILKNRITKNCCVFVSPFNILNSFNIQHLLVVLFRRVVENIFFFRFVNIYIYILYSIWFLKKEIKIKVLTCDFIFV